jgi:hypothetical protein
VVDSYVHLRQIGTPTGNPQTGGQLFYVKSDGYAYTKDASGTEVKIGRAADITSAVAAHAALTTTHGVAGALVGTTDTQTLTNKTLSSPKLSGTVLDSNGNNLVGLSATASAVDYLQVANAAAAGTPALSAVGTDTNIGINLTPKGTGKITSTGAFAVSAGTRSVRLSASAGLTLSTTATLVPGLTTSITPASASEAYFVMGTLDCNQGANVIVGELFIDGVADSSQIIVAVASGNRITASQSWLPVNLSAAAHTIELRARSVTAASGSLNGTHSTLTIIRAF